MMMSAHALVAPPGEIRVWIGIFDTARPDPPSVVVPGGPVAVVVSPLRPIRDGTRDAFGQPLNHRCVLTVRQLTSSAPLKVEVTSGTARQVLTVKPLPANLPTVMDGEFNILLSSCYSRRDDDAGLLGKTVSRIRLRPDMTLLLGDQVYGDLPVTQDLPADDQGVARKIGDKYRANFAPPVRGCGGLTDILARAPVACVADDHEYWNNYPFRQAQLPKTWTGAGRAQWTRIARELYEDYQLDTNAGTLRRIDLDPLRIVILDTRSDRLEDLERVVSDVCLADLKVWADELMADRRAGKPAYGMVVSGQALMVEGRGLWGRHVEDAELANYTQFQNDILRLFEDLTSASVPLVYVTGDVHWSRVAVARNIRTGREALYEVIASPSCLIRVPGKDDAKESLNGLRGLFGTARAWPRHGKADPLPVRLRERGLLVPNPTSPSRREASRQGNQVAVLSLAKAGKGIDFRVTYFGISDDPTLSRSAPTETYSLRNI